MEVLETPKNRSSPEDMSSRYRFFRAVMLFVGRIFLGFTVYGEEKMPRKGALVVAAVALTHGSSQRWVWLEPLGALAVTALAVLLLAWEAGSEPDEVGLLDVVREPDCDTACDVLDER